MHGVAEGRGTGKCLVAMHVALHTRHPLYLRNEIWRKEVCVCVGGRCCMYPCPFFFFFPDWVTKESFILDNTLTKLH